MASQRLWPREAWDACILYLWQMTHPLHIQMLVYHGHHSRSSPPTTMGIPWSRAYTMVRLKAPQTLALTGAHAIHAAISM